MKRNEKETSRKMKKLLVITDNYMPNFTGVTKVLNEVLPKLKGFDITLIYPSDRNYKLKGTKTKVMPFYFKLWGLPIAKLNREVEKEVEKADIVWIQFASSLAIQAIAYAKKLKPKKPVVAYLHLFEDEVYAENTNVLLRPFRFFIRAIANHFYNKCDLLIVPSPNLGDKARELGIKIKQKVVPLGVERGKPKKFEEKSENEKFTLGFVGRISHEKDLETLIKAYKMLKEKYKLEILIVGGGRKSEIERIRKLGDNDKNVKLLGFVEQPDYTKFDIFVSPSLTETTSLVTLEAMSHGLPVVSTRVGYIEKYVENKINGLFFEERNAEDLARKIEMLIKSNELRKKLAANAIKTASRFSWEKTASELSRIFREI